MRKLDRFDFKKMTRLYHFTSLESACKIISSGHLRFGKYSNQNDLIETNRVVWERTLSPDIVENDDNLIYAEKEMRRLKKSLPVFTYEYDLDWYTLFEDFMLPVWTEQCGFM